MIPPPTNLIRPLHLTSYGSGVPHRFIPIGYLGNPDHTTGVVALLEEEGHPFGQH